MCTCDDDVHFKILTIIVFHSWRELPHKFQNYCSSAFRVTRRLVGLFWLDFGLARKPTRFGCSPVQSFKSKGSSLTGCTRAGSTSLVRTSKSTYSVGLPFISHFRVSEVRSRSTSQTRQTSNGLRLAPVFNFVSFIFYFHFGTFLWLPVMRPSPAFVRNAEPFYFIGTFLIIVR